MTGSAFSLTIRDVFAISPRAIIVTGTVEGAPVRINDRVIISGGGRVKAAVVSGVEVYLKRLDLADVHDNAGLLLRDVSTDEAQIGFVITHAGPAR
jgi:translation elongation factor EF-Tu-like GTPase